MIWIIGAGYMAKEYSKVLQALDVSFQVIGRSEESAKKFTEDTALPVISGGVDHFLSKNPVIAQHAIVCTSVETLPAVTISLLNAGVKSILLEKPGALCTHDLERMLSLSKALNAQVLIGYNRRFYQATLAAENMIKQDGPLTAVNFEITEWAHRIKDEPSCPSVKNKWMLSNTSHVLDLVFFIAGAPKQHSVYTSGSLEWHPSAARFVGAGVTTQGALWSYHGYWDAPGRWAIEYVTTKKKYIFRPMEKLNIQLNGSLEVLPAEGIDYSLDEQFKPGLYLQTDAFLKGDHTRLCSLPAQKHAMTFYQKMAGYTNE